MLRNKLSYIGLVLITIALIFSLPSCGLLDGDDNDDNDGQVTAEGGDCVWVDPYFRTDGTCVRGHWRSSPGRDCSLVGSEYEECP